MERKKFEVKINNMAEIIITKTAYVENGEIVEIATCVSSTNPALKNRSDPRIEYTIKKGDYDFSWNVKYFIRLFYENCSMEDNYLFASFLNEKTIKKYFRYRLVPVD